MPKQQEPLAELFHTQTAKLKTQEEQSFQQQRLALIADYRQLIVQASKTLRDQLAVDQLETIQLKRWGWSLWRKPLECVGLKLIQGVYLIPDHASLATLTERDRYEEIDFAVYFDDWVTDGDSLHRHTEDYQPLAQIKKKLEGIIRS